MAIVSVSPRVPGGPRRVILVSIGAAIVTMALKFGAYLLTASVSLLSDAAESSVNWIAALVAFVALTIATRPADESYRYGYEKAEYFSSGVEGALILVAALTIIYTAIRRFLDPARQRDVRRQCPETITSKVVLTLRMDCAIIVCVLGLASLLFARTIRSVHFCQRSG